MYKLVAINDQEARVYRSGETIEAAKAKFDAEFHREGWNIYIENEEREVIEIVQETAIGGEGV